jgi:hypothetical protein
VFLKVKKACQGFSAFVVAGLQKETRYTIYVEDRKARRTVVDLFLSLRFAAGKHSLNVLGQDVELEVQ